MINTNSMKVLAHSVNMIIVLSMLHYLTKEFSQNISLFHSYSFRNFFLRLIVAAIPGHSDAVSFFVGETE